MAEANRILEGTSPERFDAFLDVHFPTRKIDRVLLVNPPDADSEVFRFETAHRGRNTNFAPYGLGVIAENLRQANIDVRICNLNNLVLRAACEAESADDFDFNSVWQHQLDSAIADFKPDMIGVSCMFTMTHNVFGQVCERAAGHDIPVAIGGVHVSNDVERVMGDIPSADIAFMREGDLAIRRFVNVVRKDLGAENLAQVIFNDGGEKLYADGAVVPSAEEMDVIPALDLMNVSESARYGTIGSFYFLKDRDTRLATVLTNRGCRAQCTFCSVRNFNGVGVRHRSISSVVDEFERLQNDHGIGHVMLLDDDAFKDHRRAISLYNEMVRRGLTLTWDASNGVIASSCTEEVISAAVESGCIALHIGMESGNRQILKEVKKPGTPETFLRAAEVLRKFPDLYSSAYIIIGFPNENISMIRDTMSVSAEMDLDWYRISILQPLPNTPIYESMNEQGLISNTNKSEVRMALGSYGKVNEKQNKLQTSPEEFREMFDSLAADEIPDGEQITDIWFYMNYKMNFHRLFNEKRPLKLEQQRKMLTNLVDIVSPEHGFGLYFLALMEKNAAGQASPATLERLHNQVAASPYWSQRLAAYGLDPESLAAA
ncbi:MAG: B12-binding domain-containing radical SAM protein [Rhodospirillaceae bacterium]|jgi:radical SAM superfamily enzyme YgiQ (UPF0313 family)|nr:B12-binding domain-containing radical SAM protein [Rhodospirillales bacterium]MBT3906646.1 B12-binding domain-containing radical SAM protein [Rhodospirillaceae bacterium]MBT4702426.1 B12-binding domain-containing radical SAM protein [Rhodospirillaceae bacterium]MBT5036715.1 B12-binding domain-containing radical SAM protein [Rhodospirillaceae bacterium]MBT6219635.1 B12-binding domain-containing radical SAM protein [Rhodospirillaceae bacterium]